jgi:DNA-binding XRE family transcriptional regulator
MHHNKIAMLRKSWGLSQPELATLLGVSRSTVSRLERDALPVLVTVLTLEALFDVPLSTVFPQHFGRAVDALLPRLADFSVRIEGKADEKSERKRQLLTTFAGRSHNLPV